MIVIIDYGVGNLCSISYKIKKMGFNVIISSDKEKILNADKLILPGVGAFSVGIKNLNNLGLISILNKKVIDHKIPILGICLGMQLFTNSSEEGNVEGLKWIDAETKRFSFKSLNLKIPHMGWNSFSIKKQSLLFKDIPLDTPFYFVHSYHLCCKDKKDVLCTTNYGYEFVSAVQKGNIYGVQFHPEKSHKVGLNIIKNFLEFA